MCISHRWRASLYLHVCQHQSHEQRVKIRVPCPRSLGSQMPRGENAKSANLRFGERERNNVRGAAHGVYQRTVLVLSGQSFEGYVSEQ